MGTGFVSDSVYTYDNVGIPSEIVAWAATKIHARMYVWTGTIGNGIGDPCWTRLHLTIPCWTGCGRDACLA